jgi:5-methylcytosine-specific restriction endonuclease McrA
MSDKKQIREAFRNAVFDRDGHMCRKCEASGCKLDAHHITDRTEMPNGGYVRENGISLCEPCHEKAEVWHASGHQRVEPGYSPDELYETIGSSLEEAWEASEQLDLTGLERRLTR